MGGVRPVVAMAEGAGGRPRKPDPVVYMCGRCEYKQSIKLSKPQKVACEKCGSRMLYKTRPTR